MRKLLVLCFSTLLFVGAVILPASIVADDSGRGVTRTQIEGFDNWGYRGGPVSETTINCPGGELVGPPPDCSDSTTDRLHFRGGSGWTCVTSNDPRMTGIGLYTSNANFDADSNGPVWGEWKIVPMMGCNKDAYYSDTYEDFLEQATSFWHGTWNGQRQFDPDKNVWVGDVQFVGKGTGGDVDGLHFKGKMWITMYTPFPMPYEYLPPMMGLFDEPEAYFIGEIKE